MMNNNMLNPSIKVVKKKKL